MAVHDDSVCPLCGRSTHLTFHHLIPRKMHRRKHFKKNYSKEELNLGIRICRTCHTGIHRRYDEMTLAKRLNTLKALQGNSELRRFFAWVGRQRIQ